MVDGIQMNNFFNLFFEDSIPIIPIGQITNPKNSENEDTTADKTAARKFDLPDLLKKKIVHVMAHRVKNQTN